MPRMTTRHRGSRRMPASQASSSREISARCAKSELVCRIFPSHRELMFDARDSRLPSSDKSLPVCDIRKASAVNGARVAQSREAPPSAPDAPDHCASGEDASHPFAPSLPYFMIAAPTLLEAGRLHLRLCGPPALGRVEIEWTGDA